MNAHKRVEVEKKIVGKVVADLLAAGLGLSIDVDEDGDTKQVLSPEDPDLFACDECRLYVDGKIDGWVYFVFGNDGWDVMSDHTINLTELLKPANELADKLEPECR